MTDKVTSIKTNNPIWDDFVPTIKWFLEHDKSHFTIDGHPVSGYRSPDTNPIWLRDHTHQMKGFKYFETDMKSALDIFDQYQMEDGAFYDFFVYAETRNTHESKAHDRFEYDEKNRVQFARCGVEADVEYLAVESVYTAWQATGDDGWMKGKLPALEKGLNYSLTSPVRWSEDYQLVKRPFTIDTWDFEYGDLVDIGDGKKAHRSEIDGNNLWCIMHGDNTGMHRACLLLSRMYEYSGDSSSAARWFKWAKHFRERTNKVCWNGRFYSHQVHITPVNTDVDEKTQLSLSNGYDMNRGVPSHEQCVSIIKEYLRRRETSGETSIAEWFSIDPPFPSGVFGLDYLDPGVYVNGGVMPLVGGELARAAFENGFEDYGVDILKRYHELAVKPRETYLWYKPNGEHWSGGSFLATDGWGSAAMLYALIEGLAGVEDRSKQFEKVRLSPRWTAAGEDHAEVTVCYAASEAYFSYIYDVKPYEMNIRTEGSGKEVEFHVMRPYRWGILGVYVDGRQVTDFAVGNVESTQYIDFNTSVGADVQIRMCP